MLIADLSDIEETKILVEKANTFGIFEAVIHNAGVYQTSLQQLLYLNTLAPFILTGLMSNPRRLVYLSSGMYLSGHSSWSDKPTYSDTKLHVLMLAKTLARKWQDVKANAVDPGWVPTKIGGAGAPDDLKQGYQTLVWLAVSDDPGTLVSGQYFQNRKPASFNRFADDMVAQDWLLDECACVTKNRFCNSSLLTTGKYAAINAKSLLFIVLFTQND